MCSYRAIVVVSSGVAVLYPGQAGFNPGLQALWTDEQQRRLDQNLSVDLQPPSSPGYFSNFNLSHFVRFALLLT